MLHTKSPEESPRKTTLPGAMQGFSLQYIDYLQNTVL